MVLLVFEKSYYSRCFLFHVPSCGGQFQKFRLSWYWQCPAPFSAIILRAFYDASGAHWALRGRACKGEMCVPMRTGSEVITAPSSLLAFGQVPWQGAPIPHPAGFIHPEMDFTHPITSLLRPLPGIMSQISYTKSFSMRLYFKWYPDWDRCILNF